VTLPIVIALFRSLLYPRFLYPWPLRLMKRVLARMENNLNYGVPSLVEEMLTEIRKIRNQLDTNS
jgi:hypothetical protein